MASWRFKSCPRCGGDLLIEKDILYGWKETCFQCSFSRALKELAKTEKGLVNSGLAPVKVPAVKSLSQSI